MNMYFQLFIGCFLSAAISFTVFALSEEKHRKGVQLELGHSYQLNIPNLRSLSNAITYEQELEQFSQQLVRAFGIPINTARKYAPIIVQAEINTGLSEIKIASLIMTESTFNDEAVSFVGAYGSTQIRPEYWTEFCASKSLDIFSFEGNVLCGAEIITYLGDKFCEGELLCALEHYNVGRGNLLASTEYQKAGRRYTKKINGYSDKLKVTIAKVAL
jgi:soluble lytic murein transglycosylase-like protein